MERTTLNIGQPSAPQPSGELIARFRKIVGDKYPYFVSRDWDIPNRAERITALLDATPLQ